MTQRRVRNRMAVLSASAAAAALLVGAPPATASRGPTITMVVGGLAAPRGITFDGGRAMYVAESGVAGSGPAGMTETGKVSKYAWHHSAPSWSTTFNSLYDTINPTAPPDVLGPEGLSALGGECSSDQRSGDDGCPVTLITGESTPGVLATSGGRINDPQAGRLFHLNRRTGEATVRADVGSQMFRFTGDHQSLFPSDFPDSNPFGVLVTKAEHSDRTRTFVADAGANTISEITRDGTARVISYIPNEAAVPFRDSTPTCIAQGRDGYLYVGTLHFVANLFTPGGGGFSDVWRVDPNANFPSSPTVWASGLSTITGCTFDEEGDFWATELFAGGPTATPPGDIVRVRFHHPTVQDHFGAGRLALPGGIAQGPDGAMYVTVGSAAPGANGAVMRVAFPDASDD